MGEEPDQEAGNLDIAARLEEEIALGQLRPRERLVEDDLMARFEVKRHVIRKALQELETIGIVSRQHNKGASVRDFRPKEVQDLYEVRILVERRAAELIPFPVPTELIDRLKSIHEAHKAAVAVGDLPTVFHQNLQFHRVLFSACENPALVDVIDQFAQRTHAIRSYTIGDSQLLEKVCEEHGAMIEALVEQNREALVRLVTQHIEPAKQAYLRLVR